MGRTLAAGDRRFRVRAVLVGERIDLRALGAAQALATNPLTIEVQGGGGASLFRFGVYEKQVSSEFDHVEQFATELQTPGRIPGKGPEFLKKIGTLLLVEQRMVGRAEITVLSVYALIFH